MSAAPSLNQDKLVAGDLTPPKVPPRVATYAEGPEFEPREFTLNFKTEYGVIKHSFLATPISLDFGGDSADKYVSISAKKGSDKNILSEWLNDSEHGNYFKILNNEESQILDDARKLGHSWTKEENIAYLKAGFRSNDGADILEHLQHLVSNHNRELEDSLGESELSAELLSKAEKSVQFGYFVTRIQEAKLPKIKENLDNAPLLLARSLLKTINLAEFPGGALELQEGTSYSQNQISCMSAIMKTFNELLRNRGFKRGDEMVWADFTIQQDKNYPAPTTVLRSALSTAIASSGVLSSDQHPNNRLSEFEEAQIAQWINIKAPSLSSFQKQAQKKA